MDNQKRAGDAYIAERCFNIKVRNGLEGIKMTRFRGDDHAAHLEWDRKNNPPSKEQIECLEAHWKLIEAKAKQQRDMWHEPTIVVDKMRDVEKAHILYAYHVCNNNKTRTAKVLGLGTSTVQRKLKKYLAEKK